MAAYSSKEVAHPHKEIRIPPFSAKIFDKPILHFAIYSTT